MKIGLSPRVKQVKGRRLNQLSMHFLAGPPDGRAKPEHQSATEL